MDFSYLSIENSVEEQIYREKGSKFVGYLFPIIDENDSKEKLNYVKEKHPKATHFCYAYRLGESGENYRANDDGEPNGSAGLPILNQLLSAQISHVFLVIVRYYGGTKLGVNGLVKAYKDCAKMCISEAQITGKQTETILKLSFPIAIQNQIFTIAHRFSAKTQGFEITHECCLTLVILQIEKEEISKQLNLIFGVKILENESL